MMSDRAAILRDRFRRALPWLAIAGLFALLLTQMHGTGTSDALKPGAEAPALVTRLSNGQRFELAQQRGHVVVVNFWASWCPPCRQEAPVLTRAHRKLRKHGGLVVGVTPEHGSLEEMATAARELGMHYPVALGSSPVMQRFQVDVLPTTYVVGPDGTVVRGFVGAATAQQLDQAIAKARAQTR